MDFARARAAADVAPYKAMHHKRGLTTPNCPTGVLKNITNYLLTDNIGKIFPPNKLGHGPRQHGQLGLHQEVL